MSRNQTPTTPGAPVSFKSNPQRNKTTKWTKAPTYSYEGDEWGGYDDGYYGYDDAPPPPVSSQMPLPSQMPYQQGRPRHRTNSFDHGDEGRNFSAPVAPPPSAFPPYEEQRRPSQDVGPRSAASASRGSNDLPQGRSRPRDFTNPEQVPPPLSTRATATPMSKNSPTPNEWFPPRKSSLKGGTAEAAAQAAEARAIAESVTKPPGVADSEEKPLPFIRPSDIYKRIPEERRRQSESGEGARPSMDTIRRETEPTTRPLEPVAESRESRLLMDEQMPGRGANNGQSSRPSLVSRELRETSPTLPQLAPVSGFGDEFTRMLHGGSDGTSRPAPYTGEHDTVPAANVLNTSTSASAVPSDPRTNFSSLQTTPTTPQTPQHRDPAAQIAVERQHDLPVEATANKVGGALQHQDSVGFRSTVHQAFDRDDAATLSRDNSAGHGSSGIGRSDTNSTAGISPIMSRVPAAWQAVTPIAEEPSTTQTPSASRPSAGLQGQHRISRKPSPGSHSRNASAEHPVGFEPGYRRSLDPPSTGTSPARTPEFESTANKRLSAAMSAVQVNETEAPDVVDQAAGVPDAHLESTETPASEGSEVRDLGSAAVYKPLPTVTRGRSGTNYSEREADLAATVKSSPDKETFQPAIAEAQRDSQKLFLETHQSSPRSTAPNSPNTWVVSPKSGTPTRAGRADSPAKSRVREIADKFHQIHEHSRRNSATSIGSGKSSWSQFSTDAPRLKRQGTSQSNFAPESPAVGQGTRELVGLAAPQPRRPQLGSDDSFRPDLPGGWISAAPTPSRETPPPLDRAAVARESSPLTPTMPQGLERATSDEKIDLTPTTKKQPLQEVPSEASSEAVPTLQRAASDEVVDLSPTRYHEAEAQPAAFAALKQHGDQLGSSFISQYGVGHQTRDFASAAPAAPVDQPETQIRAPAGAIFAQPHLIRMESDSTNAPTSVASSVAPTSPAKDAGAEDSSSNSGNAEYFDAVAPLRLRSREASPEAQQLSPHRPGALPSLSTDTGAGELDNDRLRHEIVRSLDPIRKDESPHGSFVADAARTQDALDAPINERRAEHGQEPLPTVDSVDSRPGFLDTRFSWENREDGSLPSHKAAQAPEPHSPEVKPEMPYERGRDKKLHVMNPEEGADSPVAEDVPVLNEPSMGEHDLTHSPTPAGSGDRPASPTARSPEYLEPEDTLQPAESKRSLQGLAPSSISEDDHTSRYLPSYYADPVDDSSGSSIPHAPEKTHENASSMSPAPESISRSKTNAPIPPFRNILAMKTADERITTYNETRETFASMNTGLGDWLNKMLETHPEHANLSTSYSGFKAPALQSSATNTFKRGHKATPSLANFKNKFGSGGETQRTTSIGSADGPVVAPQKSTFGDGKGVDMDEVKAKGKEFMKNANVLGGKASQGAKSWFNKSKNRLASGSGSVKGGKNEV